MPARFVSSTPAVPITSQPASSSSSSVSSSPKGCGFCKRNREAHPVIMSHELKDASGKVTCPQLRKYRCPGCGATGDDAHTRSYCPQLTGVRQQQQQQQQRQTRPVQESGAAVGFRAFMPTTSATFLGNRHLGPPQLDTPSISFSQQRPIAPVPGHGPVGGSDYRPMATNANYNQQNYHNRFRHFGPPQQQQQQQQYRQQLFGNSSNGAAQVQARLEVSPPTVGGGGGGSSSSGDIYLGRSQALNNMGKVTNSRYNSAGRLRHRSSNKRHNQAGQYNFNHRY